jgi:hypothetical protein
MHSAPSELNKDALVGEGAQMPSPDISEQGRKHKISEI